MKKASTLPVAILALAVLFGLWYLPFGHTLSPLKTDYKTGLEAFNACMESAKIEIEEPSSRQLIYGDGGRLLQLACIDLPAKDTRARAYVAQVLHSRPTRWGETLEGFLMPPYGITYPKEAE